ncbi:MAG: lysine--tRNA ligase, partial [Clostridia bacterium]|nr:lysine--tRNA ligase [Clostridia bacterium]
MQNNENTTPLTEEEERELLAEQARIRREKLAKLCGEGSNPYEKTKYEVTANSLSVKENFEKLE